MFTLLPLITTNGILLYQENYDEKNEIDNLTDGINWRNDTITMFGKTHPQPRKTAWYGDENIHYAYSGIKMVSEIWTPALTELRNRIEFDLNAKFNSVLINFYRDGDDHMSWHSDNEKSLGKHPLIASLSYGHERLFQLKHKTKDIPVVDIIVQSGSLIVMKNELQENWNHRIMKSKKVKDPRLNLTFRFVHQ